MKILIVYASTEGQTRKIAQFCADHLIEQSHSVEVLGAGDAKDVDLGRFDAALVAGSVHAGRYQKPLVKFATRQAEKLNGMNAAFMSVSLAAAGDDAEDWDGLKECVARFASKTGWSPPKVFHVAGAFRFTEYDFFKSWAMRWIASQKGEDVDPHVDKEMTDWAALKSTLDNWLGT